MKKLILNFSVVLLLLVSMSSCYTYTVTVGNGAQTGMTERKMNHYLIAGLAPVSVSDPKDLAKGAEDYDVTIQHTFIDGLIAAITFGIYTPTTTIVRR
ncbi:Bor family protein [Nitritalea halalkaliphila]|nr:Bor family protein [Nitritalea halalkaliphila]